MRTAPPARRRRASAALASCTAVAALALSAFGPGAHAATDAGTPNVVDLTIAEMGPLLVSGELTSVNLVQQYLDRIAAYEEPYGDQPGINAVITMNPNALAEAAALDEELAATGPRGPLHGVPVLIKDNYETADMPTSAGSVLLADHASRQDATLVANLRAAGAVVVAKVNMDEWAFGRTGTSSLGGVTRNPHDQALGPGGSSAGTGAGVAASFGAAGLGSDTCGSIRVPAAFNNLAGLRPTDGVNSRAGIIPMAVLQDVGGPIAKSVTDVAIMMDAIAGADDRDPLTLTADAPASFTAGLAGATLEGKRIGLIVNPEYLVPDGAGASTTELIRAAMDDLAAQGAEIVEVTLPAEVVAGDQATEFIMTDLARDLDEYFANAVQDFPADVAALTEPFDAFTFDDVVASGVTTPGVQAVLEISQQAAQQPASVREEQVAARAALQQDLAAVFDAHGVDALAYPTAAVAVPELPSGPQNVNCGLSSHTGFPALSVPAGFTAEGQPVGLELLGTPFSDAELLAMGYVYEQSTGHHRAPGTVPALAAPEIDRPDETASPDPETEAAVESGEELAATGVSWEPWAVGGALAIGAAVVLLVSSARRERRSL